MSRSPVLFLIPTPLGGSVADSLTPEALVKIRTLRDFVAENAKTARAFLAEVEMPCPIRELQIIEHNVRAAPEDAQALLAPMTAGRDLGLMSEAGCPAIADPGAWVVAAAHAKQFRVEPLIGPSSLVLALMASGLQGQRFTFHGYLPRDAAARQHTIRQLEARSATADETQLFIETHYRNAALFQALLDTCRADTRLCVAQGLTLPDAFIQTREINAWRQQPVPILKQPAVFLLLARGKKSS